MQSQLGLHHNVLVYNKFTVYNRVERSGVVEINNVSISTSTDSTDTNQNYTQEVGW